MIYHSLYWEDKFEPLLQTCSPSMTDSWLSIPRSSLPLAYRGDTHGSPSAISLSRRKGDGGIENHRPFTYGRDGMVFRASF